MRKQISCLIILVLVFISNAIAQKNKPPKNEQPASISPQISLDQRLGELSKEISDELTGNQKTTVAVAEFVDLNGKVSDFGKFLAEELVTRLYKTKKLKVIERQRLDKVIAEQKLSLTEIIEASSAKRIGRILGVDAIVVGTISEVGNNFRVNSRIINTETGELLAAAGVSVVKDQEVCSLINCGAKTRGVVLPIPSQTPTSQPIPTPTPTFTRKESGFFTFDLQSCKLSGTSVICDFIVTNNDKDRNLEICEHSEIYDDNNNVYRASDTELANKRSGGYNCAEAFLVSGVPTKARVIFNEVSSNATKIMLFRLASRVRTGDLNVEYRNVPLR